MDLQLQGKVALVTGGSHGIGFAIAKVLAREGCAVAICSRSADRLAAARAEIGERCVAALRLDALDSKSYPSFLEALAKEAGVIDVLINNVGGGGRWGKELAEETAPHIWAEVMQKNAFVAAHLVSALLPGMRARRWGRVVCIASIYGKEGGGRPWFNMAKAAQISLMKSLALNRAYASDGITFNTVCPGAVDIPGTGWGALRESDPAAYRHYLDANCPSGRLADPEDIAWPVAFLCSPLARHVNGTCLMADGAESRSF